MTRSTRRTARALCLGVLALLLVVPAADAKKKDKYLERFTGRAYWSGATSQIEIALSRWSSDEERELLARTLIEEGNEALTKALEKQEETGFVKLTNTLGRPLRYAREFQDGETRIIRLVTDRPIFFGELDRGHKTLDYSVTLIELRLGPDGTGEGVFLGGVQLAFNRETGTLEVKHRSTEPVRLTKVRKR